MSNPYSAWEETARCPCCFFLQICEAFRRRAADSAPDVCERHRMLPTTSSFLLPTVAESVRYPPPRVMNRKQLPSHHPRCGNVENGSHSICSLPLCAECTMHLHQPHRSHLTPVLVFSPDLPISPCGICLPTRVCC